MGIKSVNPLRQYGSHEETNGSGEMKTKVLCCPLVVRAGEEGAGVLFSVHIHLPMPCLVAQVPPAS